MATVSTWQILGSIHISIHSHKNWLRSSHVLQIARAMAACRSGTLHKGWWICWRDPWWLEISWRSLSLGVTVPAQDWRDWSPSMYTLKASSDSNPELFPGGSCLTCHWQLANSQPTRLRLPHHVGLSSGGWTLPGGSRVLGGEKIQSCSVDIHYEGLCTSKHWKIGCTMH